MKYLAAIGLIILFLSSCKSNSEPLIQEPALPNAVITEVAAPPRFTPTPILPPELEGDIEIQQLLLSSHNRWKSLDASYVITNFPAPGSEGEPEITKHQILISQPAKFKVEITPQNSGLITSRLSDGETIIDSNGDISQVPNYVFEPFNPPNYPSDTVYTHPLAGFLGTPISELIFPAGLAQRGGIYKQTGTETVAGRQADVVEWSREPNLLIDRFWVDSQTGVILRQQSYGKEASGSPVMDIQVDRISIDTEIPSEMFNTDQIPTPAPTSESPKPGTASITVLDLKGILNVRSGPNTAYKVVTTIEPGQTFPVIGRNETGEWWKIEFDGQVGWVIGNFVEFSGDLESVPITDY